MDCFWNAQAFTPTSAQRRVALEIAEDLRAPYAMARLVQGDVGCGKTAIAFSALYACALSGYQGAMMAPTEVLAAQHFQSSSRMLEPLGIHCGLLTGRLTAKAAPYGLCGHCFRGMASGLRHPCPDINRRMLP